MLKSFTIKTFVTLAIFFSGLTSAYATQAQSPSQIPIDVFAAPPSASMVRLSPEGDAIGMVVYEGEKKVIFLQNLDGTDQKKIAGRSNQEVLYYRWVNNDAIIIVYKLLEKGRSVAGRRFTKTRLYSFNRRNDKFEKLIKPDTRTKRQPNYQSNIIDYLPDDPNHILIAIRIDGSNDSDAYKLDIRNGSKKNIVSKLKYVQNYWTDANHEIRIASGVDDQNKKKYLWVKSPEGNWVNSRTTSWSDDYDIINFSKDSNILFVSGTSQFKTDGIYKLDYTTGKIVESVFEQADVDVDSLVTDPYLGHAIGVAYTRDLTEYHYFDPEYANLYAKLKTMLKGYSVTIVDKARQKPLYLVSIKTGQHPTSYLLFDGSTNNLSLISKTRESINPNLMSPKRRVDYPTKDGTLIPAYISLPLGKSPRKMPVVIMPHGGPHVRMTAHWSAFSQHLVSRGYIVFEPNFRGSTGFGDDFYLAGKKQWGGLMQDDVTDGVKWLIQQGLADPKRICIAGISYGGYAAAYADIKNSELYACGISINGVLDIPYMKRTDKNFLGGNIWIKNMVLEGEEDESISPLHRANEINMPMLLISAKDDMRVPWEHAKDLHTKLTKLGKDSTYVSLKDGGHSMLTQKSRKKAMEAMEKFLAKHIGN